MVSYFFRVYITLTLTLMLKRSTIYKVGGMIMKSKYYKIEEVSVQTGLTKRALRYYEDIGLIKPMRTDTSYRLYTEEDIETIIKIKDLKESLGFNLNDVKVIVTLQEDLKKIFRGESQDQELIENSLFLIKKQIELIEEKEQSLEKTKIRYKEILSKLEALHSRK